MLILVFKNRVYKTFAFFNWTKKKFEASCITKKNIKKIKQNFALIKRAKFNKSTQKHTFKIINKNSQSFKQKTTFKKCENFFNNKHKSIKMFFSNLNI